MKQKIYPQEILAEVEAIGLALKTVFDSQGNNLRTIAKFSGMSVNSVKAVLNGQTGNIASYSLVAKALGTTLINAIATVSYSSTSSQPIQATEDNSDSSEDKDSEIQDILL